MMVIHQKNDDEKEKETFNKNIEFINIETKVNTLMNDIFF